MESIATRIKELKGGMSIPQFAGLIGEEKPQRLQDVLAGRQRAPEDMLVRIVLVTKCDANWLLIGEGLAPEVNSRQRALLEAYEAADENGRRLIEDTAFLAAQKGHASGNPLGDRIRQANTGAGSIQIGKAGKNVVIGRR